MNGKFSCKFSVILIDKYSKGALNAMNLSSVYLYPNKIDAFTNSLETLQSERYRKVYNKNLKIYRSVDNKVEIRVKNGDQKLFDVGTQSLVFSLIAYDTQRLVMKKDCVIRDPSKGIAYVELSRREMLDLENGFYHYSLYLEDRTDLSDSSEQTHTVNRRTPLYTDSQYDTLAVLEVAGDVMGDVEPSLIIDKFSYSDPSKFGETTPLNYTSSIIDAQPLNHKSQHTFQFYSSNYQGTVTIEASLDEQGATPKKWTEVLTFSIDSALDYQNVQGKYNWFRIKYRPTTGTIDKVLYR